MDKKNKSSTTTIKQTFSYGKSKTVTVEVIKKKDNLKKLMGAEESILMSNNSPYIFALIWLISEKRV